MWIFVLSAHWNSIRESLACHILSLGFYTLHKTRALYGHDVAYQILDTMCAHVLVDNIMSTNINQPVNQISIDELKKPPRHYFKHTTFHSWIDIHWLNCLYYTAWVTSAVPIHTISTTSQGPNHAPTQAQVYVYQTGLYVIWLLSGPMQDLR